jgi:hypothetical protein
MRDTDPGSRSDQGGRQQAADDPTYEPPRIEDLDTREGPSITAAGPATNPAAPRQL